MQLTRASAARLPAEPALGASFAPTLLLAALGTLAVALFAVSYGTVHIPPGTTLGILFDHLPWVSTGEHDTTADAIVWQIRAPRVVLAGLVGATLAFSGAAYQAVFRNPLAEPYLIGVAAGASLGATLLIVSPFVVAAGVFSPLPAAAFAGAMLAVALSYGLARVGGAVPTAALILSGVAVSSMATAAVTYLMLAYSDRTLAVLSWILGGFNTASWTEAAMVVPYMLLAFAVVLPCGRLLNVLQLDEEQARQLGVRTELLKLVVLAAASLATAAAVAVSGLIGFVGLIVPHTVRLIWGSDYRRVLPLSACFGASFLILTDVIARTLHPGYEIPIGVVTAIAGAPFFLLLLRRHHRPLQGGA